MSRIVVKPAGPDRRVPVESLKGVYFEQDVAREVHDTRYIRRRIAAGDLIEVSQAQLPQAQVNQAEAPRPLAAKEG